MKKISGDSKYLSAGDYLAVVRDFAISKGITPAQLLKGSQLGIDDLIQPPSLADNFLVNKVGANLVLNLPDPIANALEYGLRLTIASHGALGLAVQCAANLEEGHEILKHFYNTRINSQDIQIQEREGDLCISLLNKYPELESIEAVQRFFDLSTLVSIGVNTFHLLETDEAEGSMRLLIDAPEPSTYPKASMEGLEPIFDQSRLELRIPTSWKTIPFKAADADMVKAAVEKCESELQRIDPKDWLFQVKQALAEHEGHLPSLQTLAEVFNLSAATFKRRLADHETTYQELKNEVRLARASDLLTKELVSIEEVADVLGFSDASNFSKAFRAWTGLTPKQFIQQHQT